MATTYREAREAEHRNISEALRLAGLNPQRRDGMRFRLLVVDGLTYAEIAAQQGCREDAVRKSVSRVRTRMLAYGQAVPVHEDPRVREETTIDTAEDLLYCVLNKRDPSSPKPRSAEAAEYLNVDEIRMIRAGGGGLCIVHRGAAHRAVRDAVERMAG